MIASKDKSQRISNIREQENGEKASSIIDFTSNPVDGHNVNFNGSIFTFRTSPTVVSDVLIGGTIADSIDNLNGELLPTTCTYTRVLDTLVIIFKTVGTGGNAFTLASNFLTTDSALSGGNNTPQGDWQSTQVNLECVMPDIVLEIGTTSSAILTNTSGLEEYVTKVIGWNATDGIKQGKLGTATGVAFDVSLMGFTVPPTKFWADKYLTVSYAQSDSDRNSADGLDTHIDIIANTKFTKVSADATDYVTRRLPIQGESVDWFKNGIVASDVFGVVTPIGVLSTYGTVGSDISKSGGDLTVTKINSSGFANGNVYGNDIISTGDIYFEVERGGMLTPTGGDIGVATVDTYQANFIHGELNTIIYLDDGKVFRDGVLQTTVATFLITDIIGVRYNYSTGTVSFYKNGAFQTSVVMTGGANTSVYPAHTMYDIGTTSNLLGTEDVINHLPDGATPYSTIRYSIPHGQGTAPDFGESQDGTPNDGSAILSADVLLENGRIVANGVDALGGTVAFGSGVYTQQIPNHSLVSAVTDAFTKARQSLAFVSSTTTEYVGTNANSGVIAIGDTYTEIQNGKPIDVVASNVTAVASDLTNGIAYAEFTPGMSSSDGKTVIESGTGWSAARTSNVSIPDKSYWEVLYSVATSQTGVLSSATTLLDIHLGGQTDAIGMDYGGTAYGTIIDGSAFSYLVSDVIRFALDNTANTLKMYKNDDYQVTFGSVPSDVLPIVTSTNGTTISSFVSDDFLYPIPEGYSPIGGAILQEYTIVKPTQLFVATDAYKEALSTPVPSATFTYDGIKLWKEFSKISTEHRFVRTHITADASVEILTEVMNTEK